jgi:molybdopterin molybdotransferase
MTVTSPTWDQARALAHESGHPLVTERIELRAADGRMLAEPVVAATALPAYQTSAMDGWAVSGPGPWLIVGEVLAGAPAHRGLVDGECVRIATGAIPPTGTTGVIRRERAERDAQDHITGSVSPGQDLRPAGEEATAGEMLLAPGRRLTPAHLGLAAAGGADDLVVQRRPRAAVLILGDELLTEGAARDGRVRDSLGPQIPAWLDRLGVDTVSSSHVEDTLEAHTAALMACPDVDMVVTTGGTAAGPVDHLHRALAATGGELLVDSVAVRPGHPMLMGRWGDGQWLLGLPGNPQSAVIALLTLGAPLIDALNGIPLPHLVTVTLVEDVDAPATETRLVLAQLDQGAATPTPHLGSAMLRGLALANGLAVIPPGGARAGDAVRWLPLPL